MNLDFNYVHIAYILYWWLGIQILAVAAFPFTYGLFHNLRDRGYSQSKFFGVLLSAFLVWFLASIKIPYSRLTIILVVLAVAVCAYTINRRRLPEMLAFLKKNKRGVVNIELLFFISLLVLNAIRMYCPDIAQTEKLPDFAFVNGCNRSETFPPLDPWYSGGAINYFYFGHYLTAFLTKFTGIASRYTINLMVATIFSFVMCSCYGILWHLTRGKHNYGMIGALFVAIMGNLDAVMQVLEKGIISAKDIGKFNWWESSRVIIKKEGGRDIDITINEFPFWSYTLGDLHAHVLALTVTTLMLALALNFFFTRRGGFDAFGEGKSRWLNLFFWGIVFGSIYTTNTWDFPTYTLLLAVTALLAHRRLEGGFFKRRTVIGFIQTFFSVFILGILLYLPFFLNFVSPSTNKIGIVNAIQRTGLRHFLEIFGFFIFIMLVFAIYSLVRMRKGIDPHIQWAMAGSALFLFVMTLIAFDSMPIGILAFLVSAFFIIAIPRLCGRTPETSAELEGNIRGDLYAYSLLVMTGFILIGCELIYIKDIYGSGLERQNTIFKFYYEAWVFLGVACAYIVYKINAVLLTKEKRREFAWFWDIGFGMLFVASFFYVALGVNQKCNWNMKPTLDGISYMSWRYKADFSAIEYLNKHVKGAPVILEASGNAFSHFSRISASTGLPTPLGWGNHENLWRRDPKWKVWDRKNEIERIYKTNDLNAARGLLRKYDVEYVVVADLEIDEYYGEKGDLEKFRQMGDVVHEGHGGFIVKLRN